MKQLSGLDAGFLYMETPTTYGHVSGLGIYERPDKSFSPYETFRGRVEERIGLLEPMRRRLAPVPFDLDHPYWIEDPALDLDFHIRHIAVPPPGGDKELAALVSRIIGRHLDRNHPLWEAYVIEGLDHDRWALLTKVHHATIDGAAGADFLTMLLDLDPTAKPEVPPLPATEPVPSSAEMLWRTATNNFSRPWRMAKAQQRLFQDSYEIWSRQGFQWPGTNPKPDDTPSTGSKLKAVGSAATTSAPPTPFNRSIGPNRRFAFASSRLEDIKALKNVTNATVNDVIMAVCGGALRQYLINHDSPVDRPLVAGVPVSLRTGDETERWTNRVSMIVAELPVHLEHPLERIAAAQASMNQAKTSFGALPADALQDFTQFSPPAVFTTASRLMTQLHLGDRGNQPMNLVVSNVPGPRVPLYLGGAPMVHYYPVSTVAEGQGLNITVQSYQDELDFGLVGDRELVPDIWDLMTLITDEIDALMEATASLRAAEPAKQAKAKKPAAKKPAAKKPAAKKPRATDKTP